MQLRKHPSDRRATPLKMPVIQSPSIIKQNGLRPLESAVMTTKHQTVVLPLLVLALLCSSCANFRKLGRDLRMMNDEYRINGEIRNSDSFKVPVRAAVVEWDRKTNKVFSVDRMDLTTGGVFAFLVKSPLNQYVIAYADMDRNGFYDRGEPLWLHRSADGQAVAVDFTASARVARVGGDLTATESAPPELVEAIKAALGGNKVEDVIRGHGVRLALGEKADLDDPRFAATRGEDGLWTPATFAIDSGFGIYFLERFDPSKTPVLFVHGAAGSPQDWRLAMQSIDTKIHQSWFYFYPSGLRLAQAADALNVGIQRLHERYAFERLHVVAHSMGGLVARDFIIKNHLTGGNRYINTFITFSSPWDGHEAAAMGVKYAPEVVPSWYDMSHGSEFLDQLFAKRLKGRVNHHLFYSHKASKSRILPPENDGTVSVASQTRKEAVADAVEVRGFDEDHVSILSSPAALKAGGEILHRAAR
jgi:pimeloyl-ACP methyl ester carboxylesterase